MGNNNSEYFEKYGCQVTRIRTHEEAAINVKYDLVWNFCEFEQKASSEYILSKMKSLSNNYLMVVTQTFTILCCIITGIMSLKGWPGTTGDWTK